MIEGGCDRSDGMKYVGKGMLFIQTAARLDNLIRDGDGDYTLDDDRRVREVSHLLFEAIRWWEFCAQKRSDFDSSEGPEALDLTKHLVPDVSDRVLLETVWKRVERTRHTLNAILMRQRPTVDELEQARDLCTRLCEICQSLGPRHGCF